MGEPDFSRLEKVLRMEGEPDRVPLYEHLVDDEIVSAILGTKGLPGNFEEMARRRAKFYQKMGYDYVPIEISWPISRTNILQIEDTAPLPRQQRAWVDQKHGTVESWEDFNSYDWPDDDYDYSKTIRKAAHLVPPGMKIVAHACGGVLENTMWLMGSRNFSRTLHTDPKLLEAIFDRIGGALVNAFRKASMEPGVGAMCLGDDMGLRTGTMISPHDLRKYVFPWQRRICNQAHRKDLPFILHACGNLTRIMDDLIDFVKIDAKHSFEDAIMPVAEVKRRWGDRVAILGGVDVDVLSRRDVPEVVEYVKKVMSQCLPGGCWALGSGNSIPNYVKVDNYMAMLKQGPKWGRYGI